MDIIQREKFLRKWEEMGFFAQIKRFSYDRKYFLFSNRRREIMNVKFKIFKYDSPLE